MIRSLSRPGCSGRRRVAVRGRRPAWYVSCSVRRHDCVSGHPHVQPCPDRDGCHSERAPAELHRPGGDRRRRRLDRRHRGSHRRHPRRTVTLRAGPSRRGLRGAEPWCARGDRGTDRLSRLRRSLAARQARVRRRVPGAPPDRGRRVHRPREASRRSGVPVVHAADGRVLAPPPLPRSAGGARAGAARDAAVPAGGGADQADRAHRAPARLRGGRRLRRDVVVLRGLGVPAATGPWPSLRVPRPAAGRALHLGRLAAHRGSVARRGGDDPAAAARAPGPGRRSHRTGRRAPRPGPPHDALRLAPRGPGPPRPRLPRLPARLPVDGRPRPPGPRPRRLDAPRPATRPPPTPTKPPSSPARSPRPCHRARSHAGRYTSRSAALADAGAPARPTQA
jgi:hypothetical protein